LGGLFGVLFIVINKLQPSFSIGNPGSFLTIADDISRFLVIVLLAPVFEEFLFRDWLYSLFKDVILKKLNHILAIIIALLTQAIIFGLFHFSVYGGSLVSAQGTIFGAIIAGLLFGVIRIVTKSNMANIITHAIFNGYIISNALVVIA
jgi:membrane protease YdiL (CAAX protease family)